MRRVLILFACVVVLIMLLASARRGDANNTASPPPTSTTTSPPVTALAATPPVIVEEPMTTTSTTSRPAADIGTALVCDRTSCTEIAAPPPTDPPAPPVPEPAPPALNDGPVEGAVAAWFGDIYNQAWGVSGCESGHQPGAVSPDGANWGLFQINTVHRQQFVDVTGHPWSEVLDPYLNAQFARWLYDQAGWGPWSCSWAAYQT